MALQPIQPDPRARAVARRRAARPARPLPTPAPRPVRPPALERVMAADRAYVPPVDPIRANAQLGVVPVPVSAPVVGPRRPIV